MRYILDQEEYDEYLRVQEGYYEDLEDARKDAAESARALDVERNTVRKLHAEMAELKQTALDLQQRHRNLVNTAALDRARLLAAQQALGEYVPLRRFAEDYPEPDDLSISLLGAGEGP